MTQYSHCSYCGNAYADDQPWPRTCPACAQVTYRNPLPVAVLLLPVDGGLLTVRRAIEPRRGELALPGGFIEVGEAWQQAAARELAEEAGITVDAGEIGLFDAHSAPDGTLLVFGLARPRRAADLPPSTATEEASGYVVITGPQPLAFPLHSKVAADFFAGDPDGRRDSLRVGVTRHDRDAEG